MFFITQDDWVKQNSSRRRDHSQCVALHLLHLKCKVLKEGGARVY